METIDFSCTFVRADGDRLVAAERLVCAFPHLFGATLVATDLSYDQRDHRLLAILRFEAAAFDERARARLGLLDRPRRRPRHRRSTAWRPRRARRWRASCGRARSS